MEKNDSIDFQSNFKRPCIEVDLANLPRDPCFRKKMCNYHPRDRDQILRAYLQKELINPLTIIFQEKNLEQQCLILI